MPRRTGEALLAAAMGAFVVALAADATHAAPPPPPPPPPPPKRPPPPRVSPVEAAHGPGVLEILPRPPPEPPRPDDDADRRAGEPRDAFRKTLDLSLHGYHRRLRLPGPLSPTWGGSERGSGLRTVGDIGEAGLSVRVGATLDGLRFGLAAGVSAVSGVRIERVGGAAESRDAAFGKAFGTPIEAFVGYAHGRVDGVRPFVELRGLAALVHVAVGTDGATGRSHTVFGGSLGARVGALVWINQYFFAEAGVGLGLVGAERVGGGAAIGVPIPLSHL